MATVVLIDPQDDARRLGELTLQADGHEVFSFRDVSRLLAAADSLPAPRAIVCDAAALADLQAKRPRAAGWREAPVLVLTEAGAAAPAAADSLAKPYALAELRSRVGRLTAATR